MANSRGYGFFFYKLNSWLSCDELVMHKIYILSWGVYLKGADIMTLAVLFKEHTLRDTANSFLIINTPLGGKMVLTPADHL